MQIWESVRIALRALTANKMRSILTMLGIIIGVAAVIALLSVGHGFEQYITEQFEGLGTNLLFVIPGQLEGGGARSTRVGRQRFQPLTMGDAEALADPFQVPDVVAVAPEYQNRATVVRGKLEMGTTVSGVTAEYQSVRNRKPVEGEFIAPEHVNARSRVAVIGSTVAEELFEDYEYPVGQTIKLNDVPFKVVGVLEEQGGGAFGLSFQPPKGSPHGQRRPGDGGRAGAAVGRQHIAVHPQGPLPQQAEIDHVPERPADEALDLVGAPGAAARRLPAAAGMGGGRQHAVLGGDPALSRSQEKGRDALLQGNRTEHLGAAHAQKHRGIGMGLKVSLHRDRSQLIRLPVIVSHTLKPAK